MSIQKRNGRYQVRWRDPSGARRARTFDRKKDAESFELDIRRRQALGTVLDLDAGKLTLAEWVEEWWRTYAVPNLQPKTLQVYGDIWERHIRPRLAGHELRQLTPATIEEFRAQLHEAGVGDPTTIKAMGLLQGMLKRAVVRGHLPANPVAMVDKPRQAPTRRPEPLPPATVEAIRARLRPYDATLVSVLAYAGLRPEEATALRWRDVGDRALRVYAPKTRQHRVVRLLGPLAQDLAEWRMLCGRPAGSELVFPRRDGTEWKDHHWRNWRRRIYQGRPAGKHPKTGKPTSATGAARLAGVTGDMRPYRLRASFVSLLLWEGQSIARVADQAGHDVATLARHYAGVLEDLEDGRTVSAEEAIREARRAAGGRGEDAEAV